MRTYASDGRIILAGFAVLMLVAALWTLATPIPALADGDCDPDTGEPVGGCNPNTDCCCIPPEGAEEPTEGCCATHCPSGAGSAYCGDSSDGCAQNQPDCYCGCGNPQNPNFCEPGCGSICPV